MKDSNILNIVGRLKNRHRENRGMARRLSKREIAERKRNNERHQRSLSLVRQHIMLAPQGPTYTGNPEPDYPGGAAA